MVDRKKRGKIQKFEYLKNKKSFSDEIKNKLFAREGKKELVNIFIVH